MKEEVGNNERWTSLFAGEDDQHSGLLTHDLNSLSEPFFIGICSSIK